jgi:hypothetical protein
MQELQLAHFTKQYQKFIFVNTTVTGGRRMRGFPQLPSHCENHRNFRTTMKTISRGFTKRRISKDKSLARIYFSKTESNREKSERKKGMFPDFCTGNGDEN